ncbi:diaminopimelate epimerase [Microlunatus sp. Y2014]|uniref:diaminopimelate epimerase n=1 Tax=Microlunatus sp. Y2014 TaxID=3418488 RepID=UPI003DA70B9B
MHTWSFAKGHGTGNDFVILLDRHGMTDPTPAQVAMLCDRHTGIGGDGLLRVVPGHLVDDWTGDPDLWFMDYRNADGSVAQMCGNGARVFARYLLEQGLVEGLTFTIGTRAGAKQITTDVHGEQFTVAMGEVTVSGDVEIEHDGLRHRATSVDVGNPHAVVTVEALDTLRQLDLHRAPSWHPAEAFPDGVNVEFIVPGEPGQVAMRVHERGVGETRSCGTGTVAVAAVLGRDRPERHTCRVVVPGGTVTVDLGELNGARRQAWLTGPAVLVAEGNVNVPNA